MRSRVEEMCGTVRASAPSVGFAATSPATQERS